MMRANGGVGGDNGGGGEGGEGSAPMVTETNRFDEGVLPDEPVDPEQAPEPDHEMAELVS